MNANPQRLFLRFAQVSFFHYAVLAVTLAFFPILFREKGFSPEQLGILGTLSVVASVVGQSLGVWLTHRWVAPSRIVYFFPSLGLLFLCLLFLPLQSASVFVLVFLFDCCHHGLIPQTDSQLLHYSSQGLLRFERVRLFGSLGFICGSLLLGLLIDYVGVVSILPAALFLMLCILWSASQVSECLPQKPDRVAEEKTEHSGVYQKRPLIFFFLIVACQWASHAALYVYFSVYLRELAWSGRLISLAWNLGVLAEILTFIFLRSFDARMSSLRLLQLSAACGVFRWIILANFSQWYVILPSQILHGFSFGSFLIASLKILDGKLPQHLKRTGPALLSTLGHGLGSLAGRGILAVFAMRIHTVQDYQSLFLISAGIGGFGFFLSICTLRENSRPGLPAEQLPQRLLFPRKL